MRAGRLAATLAPGLAVLSAGCDGVQSALSAYGQESAHAATLFWIMLLGGSGIVVFVTAATCLAIFGNSAMKRLVSRERSVVAAGIALPVAVLSALLVYGFWMLDLDPPPDGFEPIRISVVGEQWWWRVIYRADDGSTIETANELRVPLGRPVELELTTADVIHSFWVPPLAGKVDMIPGQANTLRFTATSARIVRGQCAEYCGGAHALMGFYVVVESPASFLSWLAGQRADAQSTDAAGAELFLAAGCGGCHRIRGTGAAGTIGPDLTHVGSRLSIGAGVLRTGPDAFARWIASHAVLKPGNRMPPFGVLSDAETDGLAAYLATLQ
jgi:cytochrome c oxidase subunit 2